MAELVAEYASPGDLLGAVERLRAAGVRDLEAFTPYELRELRRALDAPRPPIPLHALLGAIAGGLLAYGVQWWTTVVDYPLNVGGRPLHSIPAFVPIAFEGTILGGAVATVISFLWRCRLPRLWHPIFAIEGFERASLDRFFLRAGIAEAEAARIRALVRQTRALRVHEVGG